MRSEGATRSGNLLVDCMHLCIHCHVHVHVQVNNPGCQLHLRCLAVSHRPVGFEDETLGWQTPASSELSPAAPSTASPHIACTHVNVQSDLVCQ